MADVMVDNVTKDFSTQIHFYYFFPGTWPHDRNITFHICRLMANIMVDNVTKVFSTHLILSDISVDL